MERFNRGRWMRLAAAEQLAALKRIEELEYCIWDLENFSICEPLKLSLREVTLINKLVLRRMRAELNKLINSL